MKYVLFFLTLSILVASCGSFNNGKLRFVKTNNTQREIIVTSAKSDEKEDRTHSFATTTTIETPNQSSDVNRSDAEITSDRTIEPQQDIQQSSIDDSLTQDNSEIVDQAFQAERNAKAAAIQSGIGIVTPFIPLLGIIMTILGLVFYKKANRSRYITLAGERNLRLSRVFLIIDAVIIGLSLLFLLFFLVLLFL
jgi:hypothetical protein